MIAEGKMDSERPELNGKPYTFDLDRDFFHIEIKPSEVAYSDYFPRKNAPNEYVILDFDKDGRVVGYAMEGVLSEWASKSLKNRARLLWVRAQLNARSATLASRVLTEVGRRAISEAFPRIDQNGRLPAYIS